ncbi:hypothetical protein D4764_05G0006500 [Takifugu flavidus]|uniref:Uncharacterized protein n=1 Tax=Takifugu flavidus TaxID=433684 RepID=A0A5C6N4B9_9TELE|nr:hypothetical protein D4764_05G0006500 [Takifugu flavidus]
MRWRGWLEGTTQTQAALDPRLRDSARSELGLLREEPGLEARGGMRLGGGCGKADKKRSKKLCGRNTGFQDRLSQLRI